MNIGVTKLGMAWHVLRGKPLAYRMEIINGSFQLRKNSVVVECTFIGPKKGAAITVNTASKEVKS